MKNLTGVAARLVVLGLLVAVILEAPSLGGFLIAAGLMAVAAGLLFGLLKWLITFPPP